MDSDYEQKSPLHRAVWTGDVESVDRLIANGEDIDGLDMMGLTPLHHAVMQGCIEVARRLLECGACIEVSGTAKGPLHYAAGRGNTEIIKLLLSYGARVNGGDATGRTPLYYAAVGGHFAAELVLRQNGARGLTAFVSYPGPEASSTGGATSEEGAAA